MVKYGWDSDDEMNEDCDCQNGSINLPALVGGGGGGLLELHIDKCMVKNSLLWAKKGRSDDQSAALLR